MRSRPSTRMLPIALVVAGAAILAAAALAAGLARHKQAHHTSDAPLVAAKVPSFSHAFLIIGENTSASQITPAHAPFMTGSLEPRAAALTNYHSLRKTDSTGNYVGITSGQFTRCEAKDALPEACHQAVPNLFSQLDAAHIAWQTWAESMDNACDMLEHGFGWARNVYSSHHVPSLYYTQVHGRTYSEDTPPAGECLQRVLPTGGTGPNDTSALDRALAQGAIGRFVLIVPNDCENGHDPCGTRDPVHQFDDLLARELPRIEASPAFDARSIIFITWDEGGDPPLDPHHPLALVSGPLVKPGGYRTKLTHYSLLRALEEGFGLRPLGKAVHARQIAGIWR